MMRFASFCFFLALILITLPVLGSNWDLIKEDNGIRVYSKSDPSSDFIEIKAVSEVESTIESFVALMNDVDNFKNWMHAAKEAKLIQRTGEFRYTYYLLSDLPWPAQDRDVVLSLSIHRDPQTRAVYTKSRNVDGVVNEKEGIQRIQSVRTSWRFVPDSENKIKIIFHTRVLPNVKLPEWLAQQIYHMGPYNTITNMRNMIRQQKYTKASVDMEQLSQ
jgi:hypothetical protein